MKNLIFILALLIASCDKNLNCSSGNHRYIEIINQSSSKRIYWEIYRDYPNTTLNGQSSPTNNSKLLLLPNKDFKYYADPIRNNQSCWEEIFKMKGKENIYFFDADIIESIPWSEVQQTGKGLLERREIDLDYCIKNDWQVIYK